MRINRWTRNGIAVGLVAGILFFALFLGREILRALLPLITGIIVSYILLPLVEWFENLKISRTTSILLSIFLSFAIILMIFIWLIPVLIENVRDLTKVLPELYNSALVSFTDFIHRNIPDNLRNDIMRETEKFFLNLQERFVSRLHDFISILPKKLSLIIDILIGWILSFYILKDKETIIESLKFVFPERYRNEAVCFLRDIHRIVVRFIQGQLLVAFIVGIIEALGLYIVGMPYAPLLGFIGGISNVIPYFGPYIGAVPAVSIALTISPWTTAATVLVFTIVQQIDNLYLSPRIIKEKLGLHPVTTIMSVTVGGRIFGLFGLIFAVPLVAVIKAAVNKIYRMISG
ncbi:hypothetical protein CSTERLE_06655 [Thermoclostridium stercorarium subsp. leptospartum DSM 9219]|uniref:AI-2E family transporter n=1 Tax=Thermoclostridium stercorarium subsp. leptospartum DSM 9219 TaxID=1346611 RepID=A0A1B1YKI0_THEST|nr:AI-2E family transporter [Thermoclostridium stercorarium]ANX01271.1 hypothetical protein CSTERLE_06655 [Thermoclostridium stercorarium subsp. leptospartum DSM 9219]